MIDPSPQPRWRIPKQARSRDRFDRILDAAAKLFADRGFDSVTADDIAAQADTSVGGLYRFFPDKLAVFQALVDRYQSQLRDLFETMHSEQAMQMSIEAYIGAIVDSFDRFVSVNPAFRTVFVQSRLLPEVVAMDNAFNQEIAQQLAQIFAARNPKLDRAQADLLATVSVEVASGLEILSLTRDRAFQQQVLSETKAILIAYLKSYFE